MVHPVDPEAGIGQQAVLGHPALHDLVGHGAAVAVGQGEHTQVQDGVDPPAAAQHRALEVGKAVDPVDRGQAQQGQLTHALAHAVDHRVPVGGAVGHHRQLAHAGHQGLQQAQGLGGMLALEHAGDVGRTGQAVVGHAAVDAAEDDGHRRARQRPRHLGHGLVVAEVDQIGPPLRHQLARQPAALGARGLAAVALGVHLEHLPLRLRLGQRLAKAGELAVGPAPG